MKRYLLIIISLIITTGAFAQKSVNSPTLLSPANNAVNQNCKIELSWTSVPDAYYYKIQIDTIQPTGNDKFIKVSNTNFLIQRGLKFGKTYFWRIKSLTIDLYTGNVKDSSDWSAINKFDIIDKVILKTPALNAANLNIPVTLNWNEVTGVDGYEYEFDINPDFSSSFFQAGTNMAPIVNPKEIPAPTSAQLTGLLTGTKYYWRVRAILKNLKSGWSEVWNFNTIYNINEMPQLTTPANNEIRVVPNVTLNWLPLQNASNYRILLDDNPDFSSPETYETNVYRKALTTLNYGQTYYWKVKGYNQNNHSSWSKTFSFTIADKPNLISPKNNAINLTTKSINLQSQPIDGSSKYQFQVSDTSNFYTVKIDNSTNLATLTQNVTTLQYNESYYWRVRAMHAKDTSDWSDVFMFTTAKSDYLPPVLNTPADNAVDQLITIILRWNVATGSSSYKVAIDTNADFSTAIFLTTPINNYGLSSNPLQTGKTYFWKVKGYKKTGQVITDSTEWSEINTFKTVRIFPDVPELAMPANTASMQDLNVPLQWNNVQAATHYIVQQSEDIDFNNIISSDTVTSKIINAKANDFGKQFFWRVKAKSGQNYSEWSEIYNFTTKNEIFILNPENNTSNHSSQIFLIVTPIEGATDYEFMYSLKKDFKDELINRTYGLTEFRINNLEYGKKYYLKARAIYLDKSTQWTPVDSFQTISKIILTSPANGSKNQFPDVKLNWENVNGAAIYNYQMDVSPLFKTPYVKRGFTLFNNVSLDTLNFGTTYYWQIQAQNDDGKKSEYSDVFSFTTIDTVVVKDAKINNNTITITWFEITGLKSYEIEYWTDAQNKTLITIGPKAKTYTIKNLPMGNYFWSMRAKTHRDSSQWTPVSQFDITVGINEINNDELSVNVYPMPAKDKININISNNKSTSVYTFRISNIIGQELLSQNLMILSGNKTYNLNVENLNNGLYFLEIIKDNAKITKKIFIRK